jgi:hypothetical protein
MQNGYRSERCLGYGQFAAGAIDAATLLSTITVNAVVGIPAGTAFARIHCTAQAVRWRADGVDPTAAIGQPLAVNTELRLEGDFARVKFISQTAGAILNVSFFAAEP